MNIIIKKLTITPKKTTLVYIEHPHDPVDKTVVYDEGALPNLPESHADALAAWLVDEVTSIYKEELKQIPLGFNDEEPEDSDGYTAELTEADGIPTAEEPEFIHPSEIEVHFVDGTEIPDFTRIEDRHLEAFLKYRYAGEAGGYDKKDLIADIRHNYDSKIPANLGTKSVCQAALKIIRGEA